VWKSVHVVTLQMEYTRFLVGGLSLARGKENTVKATKRELEQMLHLCPWAKAEYIRTANFLNELD